MLIRIKGGSGGIKDYLENGQKQDRFFSRDELDERIILDGNLSLTDTIIESMDVTRDKYFHITLAFKEDYINHETLININQEFKKFFLAGYTNDETTSGEINYYAEAHLPKIKSYRSVIDGSMIERKPHIHIVIPTVNLLDGTEFYPSIKRMLKYINSFQEHINAKYGLASPKDNLRTNFNNSSEVISRYKGDIFSTNRREHKTAVLDLLLAHNPNNMTELGNLLAEHGYIVRMRNKDNLAACYLNIRQQHDGKGINLKDSVFRNEFLGLSLNDKLAKLNQAIASHYIDNSVPKPTDETHQQNMQEWLTTKALEIRFIEHNCTKAERHVYYQLPRTDKIAYLKDKQKQYYQYYDPQDMQQLDNSETNTQLIPDKIEIGTPTDNSDTGHNNLKHAPKDSLVTQLLQQNQEQDKQQQYRNHLHELNNNIRADVLLELASKTHGIQPELYFINKDKSGADRIKCGKRNLSVVDFCLKELNLSFKDTISLLDNAYNMQNDLYREYGWNIRQNLYLGEQYQQWFVQYKAERLKQLNDTLTETTHTRKHIIADTKIKIREVRSNQQPAQQIKQINLLKARQVFELDALSKAKKEQQKSIRTTFNLEMQSAYHKFLAQMARDGDEAALIELRRLRIKFDKQDNNNAVIYVDRYQEFRLNITYDIDEQGNICYKLNNQLIIKDTGKKVEVIRDTDDNIKLTLDLALAKFGNKLELTGTPEFRQKVVEIAIKNNYKIEFLDEYSRLYYAKISNTPTINTNTFSR